MDFNAQPKSLDVVQAKRILRQVAVMADRYGLGDESVALLKKAKKSGFYDDNIISGLIFCLANGSGSSGDGGPREAVKLYAEAEVRLGGAEQAPSSYVAAIYAFFRDRQESKAREMLNYFEASCVPCLNDNVRDYYVEFLELIKEELLHM